ncbi:MAG TPA: 4-hydroxy-3-methylbut-2-enyl diphosphate reductase [Gemmatimonadales bacterium]
MLATLSLAACAKPPAGSQARLEVQWTGTDTGKVMGRPTVEWCDSLRLLQIQVVRGDTGVALALYPGDSMMGGTYRVVLPSRADSAPPASAVALRWFAATAIRGFQGDSGSVVVERDGAGILSGKFDVAAKSATDTRRIRVHGSFQGLLPRPAAAGCVSKPAPPDSDVDYGMESTYFRRGFGLKAEIEARLVADYHSTVVEALRANQYRLTVGPLTFRLAKEFGFCYGVDRAVDYAYETRAKFPDRRLHLVGEIIHNPHVNQKLRNMGVRLLARGDNGEFDFSGLTAEDVVIMPAFGVTIADFERLRGLGCVLVDTTCGSVLNVWKRVEGYARDGFTAIIHGKHYHEETKATASQVMKYPNGRYLVVRDMGEARLVCDFIEGKGDPKALADHFRNAVSPGFDFAQGLRQVGLANQTTMLSGESLAIADEVRKSVVRRYGEAGVAEHFRSFDTICSATQERQDAVVDLLNEPLDIMVVIGGYNSSNTCHLAALAHSKGVRTYHIEDADAVETERGAIRHQPIGTTREERTEGWLGEARLIGITAGASTPNNKIGETIVRVCATSGVAPQLQALIA